MVRKSIPSKPEPPNITPQQAIILLEGQKTKGRAIAFESREDKDRYFAWANTTEQYIKRAFGTDSSNVTDFENSGPHVIHRDFGRQLRYLAERRDAQVVALDSYIEQLKTEIELRESDVTVGSKIDPVISGRIFLVHGQDGEAKHTIARFLERLKLQIVILDEMPNKGRSLLQKFSDYSDVGFAVVLLTGDDVGGPKGDTLKSRGRQNVIFELGFFLGKYPASRVCVLYEKEVELPSDFSGIGYVPYDDSGGWKMKLAKEISVAGVKIDLNLALAEP
jgi:predicted nucleotide-binding protein